MLEGALHHGDVVAREQIHLGGEVLAGAARCGREVGDEPWGVRTAEVGAVKLAQSLGVWSEGPITDPAAIGPALSRALAAVKRGEPALVDVVSQGR